MGDLGRISIALIILLALYRLFSAVRKQRSTPKSAESRRIDDHRYAKLLITELKLYNERNVEIGRRNKDLYSRMQSDIDKSREMYDTRIGARKFAHPDYFHDELVKELADGDESNLGPEYHQSYPADSVSEGFEASPGNE